MSEINKLSILCKEIFLNPGVSRQQLAKTVELSLPTVGTYLKTLDELGLIKEEKLGINNMQAGRKTNGISIIKDAAYAFGMLITRDTVEVSLLDFECNCVDHWIKKIIFSTGDAYRKQLGKILHDMVEENNINIPSIKGVGIAITAIVSEDNFLSSYNLGIDRYPLDGLTEYIPYPCFIKEVSRAPLLDTKMVDDSVTYMWIGEVISCAYVSEKMLLGSSTMPMEVNHMCMVRNGKLHICGKRGCLGAYCSMLELTEHYDHDLDAFFDALNHNEPQAVEDMKAYIRVLSQAISNIHLMMDCNFILGGPVGARLEGQLPEIKNEITDINPFCKWVNWLSVDSNPFSSTKGCAIEVFNQFIAGIHR